MSVLYYTNVTIHVLAAMLWLGGMFFLGIIGAPVLRAVEPISSSDRWPAARCPPPRRRSSFAGAQRCSRG